MANHIREYNPDVIALQGVQELSPSIPVNNEISAPTYLAHQLDMSFTFRPSLFDNEVQMKYSIAVLLNHYRFFFYYQ